MRISIILWCVGSLFVSMNYAAERSESDLQCTALEGLVDLECSSLFSLIAIDQLDLAIEKVHDMHDRGLRLDQQKYDNIINVIGRKRDGLRRACTFCIAALVSWNYVYSNYSIYYNSAQQCRGTKVADQAIFANTIGACTGAYLGYLHGSAWLKNYTQFPLLESALDTIKR
ncbi:MAG: hypothetical protein WCE21_00085 [Candidatus Babeliales bacterium]